MQDSILSRFAFGDNDLFTGREVKRILQDALLERDSSPYVRIGAAVDITGLPRSTLKAAAARNFRMQQLGERPTIRMRRTSAQKGAHWLFHEGDCWAMARDRSTPTTEIDDDPTIVRYVRKVTSALGLAWFIPIVGT